MNRYINQNSYFLFTTDTLLYFRYSLSHHPEIASLLRLVSDFMIHGPSGSKLLLKTCLLASFLSWLLQWQYSYSVHLSPRRVLIEQQVLPFFLSPLVHCLPRLLPTLFLFPPLLFHLEHKIGTIIFFYDFILKNALLNLSLLPVLLFLGLFNSLFYFNQYACYSCWGYLLMHLNHFCESSSSACYQGVRYKYIPFLAILLVHLYFQCATYLIVAYYLAILEKTFCKGFLFRLSRERVSSIENNPCINWLLTSQPGFVSIDATKGDYFSGKYVFRKEESDFKDLESFGSGEQKTVFINEKTISLGIGSPVRRMLRSESGKKRSTELFSEAREVTVLDMEEESVALESN